MTSPTNPPPVRPPRGWILAGAAAVTAIPFFVHMGMGPAFQARAMLFLFIFPILLSAYVGGLWPGLLSTFLAALGTRYLLTSEHHLWNVPPYDNLRWLLFVVIGALVSVLSESLHRARHRAEAVPGLKAQLTDIASLAPGVLYAFRLRPDGSSCFPFASPVMRDIVGVDPDALVHDATPAFALVHPKDIEGLRAAIDESARTLAPWRREFRIVHPQKGERWLEGHSLPRREKDGSTLWHGYLSDITERKAAAAALLDSRERYRSLFEHMLNGYAYCRMLYEDGQPRDFVYLEVNAAFERITGLKAVAGKNVSEVIPGIQASNPELFDVYGRVAATGRPESIETFVEALGVWFSIAVYSPTPEHFVAVFDDITERKRATEALRKSRAMLQHILDTVPQAIFWKDRNSVFLGCNRVFAQTLGCDDAEHIVGRSDFDLSLPKEHIEAYRLDDLNVMASKTPKRHIVEQVQRADGTRIWVDTTKVPLLDPQGEAYGVLGVFEDVTERKRAEEDLRLLDAAVRAAANAIVITDRQGLIQWVNPAFTAISGFAAEEVLGRNPGDLLRSGRHDAAFYGELWRTILAGKTWRGEIVNRRKDGAFYTEDMTITPVSDAAGDITHFIAVKQDVTAQKEMETHLLRTQRLESVGRLASGIAHDLNNILTPVLMAPPMLRDAIQDPELRAIVDSIEASARRGADVIRQLLTFGRGVETKRSPLQLRNVVRDMLKLIEATFPKNIRARKVVAADLLLVNGDGTQLHQVLMNLCVNARDAMPDGGILTLALAQEQVDAATAQAHPGVRPGRHVVLSVTDTGSGIAPEHVDRIFDPFFSTKPVGVGTGLGLSTVLGIVRSHQGFITMDSRPGRGTTFNIHLPACETQPLRDAAVARAPLPQGRGEWILVVDDEENVRRLTRRILEKNGYAVLEAQHGLEALATYDSDGGRVGAVVTDLMMPHMDGPALIRALRARNRNAKIIAMSGYLSQPELLQSVEIDAFLAKPCSAADLLDTLQDLLHA